MTYPIYVCGSPVLKKEGEPVSKDYPELGKLIEDMFETMYASDGVGLAAPQIGKPLKLFVIDATVYKENEPELADFKKAFINAEIYAYSDDSVPYNEGCLSFPGIHEDVNRPSRIKIRYLDENLVERDEEYGGTAARVIQHEYDHTLGKTFIDRLSPLRRTLLKSKLGAMSKGKYKADYKTRIVK